MTGPAPPPPGRGWTIWRACSRALCWSGPFPAAATHPDLALSTLTALGKHITTAKISHVKVLAICWVAGHRPRDIVIDRAHTLHPRVYTE